MYYQYFGLNEAPFSIAVNPRYLFMSARHRDALAHLLYGVGSGGGFILLTGEVGTGKTTINRCLLEQLPENTDIAIILNPALNAMELLASACDEFGIEYGPDNHTLKTLTDKLHAFLLANHERGRNTVLMIDEAQHLNFEVLEQIRLLTNLETNHEKLLQIILIGQPELAQMLQRPELRQLNQRITARYNLEPLDLRETAAYIRHRLQVAGLPADRELFPPTVVRGVYRLTRGIPRLINLLCDRVLLGAYGRSRGRADTDMLKQAAREVMGEDAPGAGRASRVAVALGLVVVAGLGWLLWQQWGRESPELPSASVPASEPGAAVRADAVAREPMVDVAAGPAVTAQAGEPDAGVDSTASLTPPGGQAAAWMLTPEAGEAALWKLTTARPLPEQPCAAGAAAEDRGPVCVTVGDGTWDGLKGYDRPILLHLVTPGRFARAAVFLGRLGDDAVVWQQDRAVSVELATLASLWEGRFSYLWHPPEAFTAPLGLWDESPAVAEVAELFAELDGQARPLTGSVFNSDLQARVRLFQRRYGLTPDGQIDRRTLLKLNELLGIDPTRAEVLDRLGASAQESPQ